MEWIFIIITALGACLSLFLSKPERPILAWITGVLILLPTGWQAYEAFQEGKTSRELEKQLTIRLSSDTGRFLDLTRDMIFFSSNGWLPRTEDEFFSLKSAELICNHLNLDNGAPVLPKRLWREWISQAASDFKKNLNQLRIEFLTVMDADLLNKIAAVENSTLLGVYIRYPFLVETDKKLGANRPPLLFPGGERTVEKELKIIQDLYLKVRELEKSNGFENKWDFLLMHSDNRWPKKLLGEDRIDLNFKP